MNVTECQFSKKYERSLLTPVDSSTTIDPAVTEGESRRMLGEHQTQVIGSSQRKTSDSSQQG